MAFPLFSPPSTILRLGLGVGLGISAATLHPLSPFRAAPMQCQYNAPYAQSGADAPWAVKPEESLLQKQGRTGLNQARGFMTKENMRQYAASKGYDILPLHRLQKYVKNVDLRAAMSEHRPFKMSFGTTMALAAFAQF